MNRVLITGVCGFFATAVVGGVSFPLFYQGHMAYLGIKFPGIVNSQPDMIPALIGGLMYIFVMAFIYFKMNVSSVREGAITGAGFGSAMG